MYSRQLGSRVSTVYIFPPFQVIETLALEDTDIKSEHIAQIKELIQKEDIIEEESSTDPVVILHIKLLTLVKRIEL